MKKILAIILSLSMVLGLGPIPVQAAGNVTATQILIADKTYYYVNTSETGTTVDVGGTSKQLSDLTQIEGTSVYYTVADGQEALTGTVYGTATLSYTDYYAGDTSVDTYDAVSSATQSKNKTFPNADSTEPTESGYQIKGVKNVSVAADAQLVVEAKIQEAAGISVSGVYAKAAAITLSEDCTAAVSQYKTLNADGSYAATQWNVKDTVKDATAVLKTTSVWGDYEIDITENSTSYIRNSREDDFAINSQIQGIILETEDGYKVGMRHMEEIWVQPYEISFHLTNEAAAKLVEKKVSKVTYLMPDSAYVYELADSVYMKPQMGAEQSFTASFGSDLKTVQIDGSDLPADIQDKAVTVYHKEGRRTTYYVQNAEIPENGVVSLTQELAPGASYTVTISSSNYADKSISVPVAMETEQTEIGGKTYYYANTTGVAISDDTVFLVGEKSFAKADMTQIEDGPVYYAVADGQEALTGTVYGTATLSYTDYYAGDTSVDAYDAVSSATQSKNKTFPNADSTEPTESGYQIKGVKNVPVAADAQLVVEAKIQEAAGISVSGVYAKAAAITLSEDCTAAVSQYKTLNADGSYTATKWNVKDTVKDATAVLKTTSVWGDYEIDITENSTSYIRNSREDDFAINSQIQGIILETEDGYKVGMRHMEEIWVQPYEISFHLTNEAAAKLVGKTVSKVTYLMPDSAYVYEFADGVYMKPQMESGKTFTASFGEDLKSVYVDITGLAADIQNPKVTVYYKEGRNTTYYAQDARIENGAVVLNEDAQPELDYTVIVSSDNYADVSISVTAPKAAMSTDAPGQTPSTAPQNPEPTATAVSSTSQPSPAETVKPSDNTDGKTEASPAKVKKVKTSRTSGKKAKVTWKKVSGVTGYQIQYSTSKKFKKAKKILVKKASKTSGTITGLKAKKKYYIRIRSYKTVSGKKYYGKWSAIKTV